MRWSSRTSWSVSRGSRVWSRRTWLPYRTACTSLPSLPADAVAEGVRRIVPLTLGWEELPKSVSVHGAPAEERYTCPIPGLLLQTGDGWLLMDTGFNSALLRDKGFADRFFGNPLFRAVLPGPGEPLEEALAAVDIDIADITAIALSHLHHDHAGGLRHFAGRVPVHVQRAELDFGLNSPEA